MTTLKKMALPLVLTATFAAGLLAHPLEEDESMDLGAFSISLSVGDLEESEAFYQTLGFARVGGDPTMNYVILRNGTTKIGLFHDMFEGNLLTFNPGWDQHDAALTEFEDVRDLQRRLKAAGMAFTTEADDATDGPASFVLTDPDGNMILVDQHVPRP